MTQTIPVMTLGWIGMVANSVSFLSQSIKAIRFKKVKSLSLKTFIQQIVGAYLWMWNSILTSTIQGTVAGGIMLVTLSILFYFFALDRGKSKGEALGIVGILIAISMATFMVGILNAFDITNVDVVAPVKLTIGFSAAVVSSTAFIPQFIKMMKDKDVKDLSWGLLIIQSFAQTIWIIFWALRMNEDLSMWLAGFAAGLLTATLFYLILFSKIWITKYPYGKKRNT